MTIVRRLGIKRKSTALWNCELKKFDVHLRIESVGPEVRARIRTELLCLILRINGISDSRILLCLCDCAHIALQTAYEYADLDWSIPNTVDRGSRYDGSSLRFALLHVERNGGGLLDIAAGRRYFQGIRLRRWRGASAVTAASCKNSGHRHTNQSER